MFLLKGYFFPRKLWLATLAINRVDYWTSFALTVGVYYPNVVKLRCVACFVLFDSSKYSSNDINFFSYSLTLKTNFSSIIIMLFKVFFKKIRGYHLIHSINFQNIVRLYFVDRPRDLTIYVLIYLFVTKFTRFHIKYL